MLLTIVLVLLILALFGGGFYGPGDGTYPYRGGGWGLGGVLLIILIVLLVSGRL